MRSLHRLHAFGDPFVSRDGVRVEAFGRKSKRLALLIYLLCDSRDESCRRDDLVAMFWPDADRERGRNALRQALFVVRDLLPEGVIRANGSDQVVVDRGRIGSDVRDFENAVRDGRLEEALALYGDEFLRCFGIEGCPEFEAWVEHRRFDLATTASKVARNLAHVAEGGRDLAGALHWWRRALGLQPFDESILRRIMALCAGAGNRGEAKAAFERFRRRMRAELGLEPSPETVQLAKAMSVGTPNLQWIGDRRDGSPGAAHPVRHGHGAHWRRASDEFRR